VSDAVGSLNLIGAGRVGRVLGRLWKKAEVFEVQDVLTRSRESASAAVRAIGAGRAAGAVEEMRAADVWLIATTDDAIGTTARILPASGKLRPGNVVFHVSGATPAAELGPAQSCGARIASVHPIKTFSETEKSAESFAGTYCSMEGDPEALEVLRPAFERIGAQVFGVSPDMKGIYHAGGVFACNYLVALIEAAVMCHHAAGIPREASLKAVEPMVRESVDAIFAHGPGRALTGPISRGDASTLRRQLGALQAWNADMAELYRRLGLLAAALAVSDGRLDVTQRNELQKILSADESRG